jgi:hypothetical protein
MVKRKFFKIDEKVDLGRRIKIKQKEHYIKYQEGCKPKICTQMVEGWLTPSDPNFEQLEKDREFIENSKKTQPKRSSKVKKQIEEMNRRAGLIK